MTAVAVTRRIYNKKEYGEGPGVPGPFLIQEALRGLTPLGFCHILETL